MSHRPAKQRREPVPDEISFALPPDVDHRILREFQEFVSRLAHVGRVTIPRPEFLLVSFQERHGDNEKTETAQKIHEAIQNLVKK